MEAAAPSDRLSLWRHPLEQDRAAVASPSSGGAGTPPIQARRRNSDSSEPHGGQVHRRDEEDTWHDVDAAPVPPEAIYADFTGAGTGS